MYLWGLARNLALQGKKRQPGKEAPAGALGEEGLKPKLPVCGAPGGPVCIPIVSSNRLGAVYGKQGLVANVDSNLTVNEGLVTLIG